MTDGEESLRGPFCAYSDAGGATGGPDELERPSGPLKRIGQRMTATGSGLTPSREKSAGDLFRHHRCSSGGRFRRIDRTEVLPGLTSLCPRSGRAFVSPHASPVLKTVRARES